MTRSTKNLPRNLRPDEKFMDFGPESLTDAELLAVILRSGSVELNSLELAKELLTRGGDSLLGLYLLSHKQMQQIPGIGRVKATQLKCIAELSRRIAKASRKKNLDFSSPASVAAYYMEDLRHQTQEHIVLSMLDAKNQLIQDKIMAIGSALGAYVTPREIFAEALRCEAVSIVLLHNHPSGDPNPSMQDLDFTKRLIQAGEMLGVPLLDHLVIGDNTYVSLRQEQRLTFSKER